MATSYQLQPLSDRASGRDLSAFCSTKIIAQQIYFRARSFILAFPLLKTKSYIDALQKYGYTLQKIAAHLDMHYSTISNFA